MKTYMWKDVSFENNYILIKSKNENLSIKLNDIWTLFYAKWSYVNFLTIGNCGFTMGYLYIAKKECMKYKDIVRIKFPYRCLKLIPTHIFKMIDFYKWNEMSEIFKISKF